MMQRFGKPSASWFAAKQWFFDQDRELHAEGVRIAELYTAQPRRTKCKNCNGRLGKTEFTKTGIDYTFCKRCGHLNGLHQDTDAFCEGVYGETVTTLFSRMYSAKDKAAYIERRDSIYRPKADFLLDALRKEGEKPKKLRFADFGAGSGHFVSALREAGVRSVTGFDVSENQLRFANKVLGEKLLEPLALTETASKIASIEADVLSMVFSLEHVQNPREIAAAIASNPRARYAFIAVPMFSPCVFAEMAFPQFAHRQLADGHTHLYTEQSIDWMCQEFGFKRIAEWWFGSDLIDFYRFIWMSMAADPKTARAGARFREMWLPILDAMQLEMDKRKLSSEIHMVVRLAAK